MRALELRENLIKEITKSEKIRAVGQTGALETELVPGKSDIDMFVLCTEVPTEEERKTFYSNLSDFDFTLQMKVCNGGIWGYGDILNIDGIDVMPMYFTISEMKQYLEEVLDCKHLYKDGRFYPVGRLSSIGSINILFEKQGEWSVLKEMVNKKQTSFFKAWFEAEMWQILDEEDLGRSELRKEVLFYHQVLESSLDHLIQAIFAINKCYFPSRKRTVSLLESFTCKPKDCANRLLQMVKDGAQEDTILNSINELRAMTKEVSELGKKTF